MNWKFISLVSLGFGTLIAGIISSAADNHLSQTAGDMAIDQRAEGVEDDLKWAHDNLDKADKITSRERKEILDGVRAWKREASYDEKIRDIHNSAVEELREFKESIQYNTRRQDIDDEFDDALDSFKDSIDYDYEMDLANAEIRDAEAVYKKHCKKIADASDGDDAISDALKDVKKSEKEKMDETVKEAKAKISSLKNKVQSEEARLNRKKQAAIRDLDQELQATKARLNKQETDACKILNDEKEKVENNLRKSVTGKRTEEEQKVLDLVDESRTVIDAQKRKDSELAKKIYETTPEHEKWAGYFKANGVPKFFVATLGALPLIPAGYLVGRYMKFIWNVLRAM